MAKKGIEPIKNLTRGLELCQQAQLCYSPEDKLHTKTLQTKGRINCELVLCGISPDENAQQAMALFSEVRQRIAPNDVLSLATYIHEGEIYQADGLSGNRKENLQKALRAYYHAQQSGNLSPLRNISMVYEQGLVYLALAQLEENPIEHVSSAAFRFEQAKEFLNQEEFGLESIKILLAHALKKLEHIQSSEGLGEELNNIEHLLRSIYTTIYDLAWCW